MSTSQLDLLSHHSHARKISCDSLMGQEKKTKNKRTKRKDFGYFGIQRATLTRLTPPHTHTHTYTHTHKHTFLSFSLERKKNIFILSFIFLNREDGEFISIEGKSSQILNQISFTCKVISRVFLPEKGKIWGGGGGRRDEERFRDI